MKEFLTVYYNEEIKACDMCYGEIHQHQLLLKLSEPKQYGNKEVSTLCFLCGKTIMNHHEHLFNTKKRRALNSRRIKL